MSDKKTSPVEHHQLDLFANTPIDLARAKADTLSMDSVALAQWKTQVFEYQQRVRESSPPQQTTLFELAPTYCNPDQIDPLSLWLQPMSFYTLPTDCPGDSAIYFILDNAVPLILYVGETCRSNKRWKGVHGCKDYIASYQDLHYRYGLQTAVNISFWWDAPVDRKARQEKRVEPDTQVAIALQFSELALIWAALWVKLPLKL